MDKVLLIDDDRLIRVVVERGLGSEQIQVLATGDAFEGLRLLESERPLVALIDVEMPDINGLEVFQKIRSLDPKIPMIFVTADTSSETTIQAMRMGAFDYCPKPINLDLLRKLVSSAIESRRLMDQPVAMSVADDSYVGERFVGKCLPMMDVFKSIGRVAAQNVAVLIRGESGSGKELVARAIVQHSDRVDKPFISVNCAAIPDQLLESELFGHEKGAFTGAEKRRIGKFEDADGGTIFLDEVGDMSPLVQGKVLRLLQDQRFQRLGGNEDLQTDVRIITATNRDLEKMVEDGSFREDLFYRLSGYTISLPPLRERKPDIPLLLEYFVHRTKREMNNVRIEGIAPATIERICEYSWPGNVRQLQSVIRHALLHTTGTVLGPEALPAFVTSGNAVDASVDRREAEQATVAAVGEEAKPESIEVSLFSEGFDAFIAERLQANSKNLYAEAVAELEKHLLRRVLEATDGNQSKTAEILGITRGKVRDRIQSFNIQLERIVN